MARPSSVELIPEDLLKELNALLADPRVSQIDAVKRINAILIEQGEDPLSKSAVNRYAVRMNEVGKRLQERHAVADMWIAKFGRVPEGQLGQLITQMVQSLAFDASLAMSEGQFDPDDMPGMVTMLKELATTVNRLEMASSRNAKREADIRADERERAADEAAQTVESVAVSKGLSRETIDDIKSQILGIKQ